MKIYATPPIPHRCTTPISALEKYFTSFRHNIIGHQQTFESPFGEKQILYADWTASGRAYQPIEECIQKEIMPFVGNTHTGSTVSGGLMSKAYEAAKCIVKEHVHASEDDVLLFCGSGMTAAVNKLQRIIGLRVPQQVKIVDDFSQLNPLRPVVFITHMEHHSNQVSWLETLATVEIIEADENGNVDLEHFRELLHRYRHRKNKIAAVTACSNVTGIETPYHEISKLAHAYGGLCFVDFACSAPYVHMDMHPAEPGAYLDAIYFSPHKFLGGPGSPGVLIFNKKMYNNTVPDQPGGGTVVYSNPWKVHEYVSDIEQREDGGTPPFLQGIKAGMCVRLKEMMGVENMRKREAKILPIIFERFAKMKNILVLEADQKKRLGVISFVVQGAHYNLIVKILNDRFGIQMRGGCSCAGTYGHKLLQVDKATSNGILTSIRSGDMSRKPGWVRLSVHPTMTNAEIDFIMDAIEATALHFEEWGEDYNYDAGSNEYAFKVFDGGEKERVEKWFKM